MAKTIADQFEQRLRDLIDSMQNDKAACYEDSTGDHYIQFRDGSVMSEPDMEQIAVLDEAEWVDFENAEYITACDHDAEDKQATAIY